MYKFPLFPLPHGSNPKFLKFQILHNYNPPNEGGKKKTENDILFIRYAKHILTLK